MSRVSLYPVISYKEIESHSQSIDISYYYIYNNELIELTAIDEVKNEFTLSDETKSWSMEEYGFYMNIEVTINPVYDFKTRYICRGTKLSLGLEWASQSSKLRGVVVLGELNDNEQTILSKNIEFSNKDFRGIIEYRLILFISSPGYCIKSEEHYANITGQILGEYNKFKIILDGQASIFPISLISSSSLPLWNVVINDDIYNEPFFNSFDIYLNQSHHDYRYINMLSNEYNSSFLKEVLSSALLELFIMLKNDGYLENMDSFLTSGDSLIDFVNRCHNVFGWRFDNIQSLHEDIKNFFDKEFK